jgi:hypothetical protein
MAIETVQVNVPYGVWVQASAGECNIYNDHASATLEVRVAASAPLDTIGGGLPIPPKNTYPVSGIAATDLVFVRIPTNVNVGSVPSVKLWVVRNA